MPKINGLDKLKVPELKTIAKKFGVAFTPTSKKVELIQGITDAPELSDTPTPVATVAQEAPVAQVVQEAPVVKEAPVVQEAPVVKEKSGEDRIYVMLHDSELIPPNGQFFAVNGEPLQLKPGEKVPLKRKYLEVLQNAVETRYSQSNVGSVDSVRTQSRTPRFPFSVYETAD